VLKASPPAHHNDGPSVSGIEQQSSNHVVNMNRRPLSITIIGWLFIVVGAIALLYHSQEFTSQFDYDLLWVCSVRFLATVGGAFLLFGFNWARWLLAVWMGFHIVISAMHSLQELLIHALLFTVILYSLFRPKASAYFRRQGGQ
jgi:hypothetical protein